jgi:hypothetical protein
MCVNYFARRYGFQPLTFKRPGKDTDYIAATNAYLMHPEGNRATDAFAAFLRPRLTRLVSDEVQ